MEAEILEQKILKTISNQKIFKDISDNKIIEISKWLSIEYSKLKCEKINVSNVWSEALVFNCAIKENIWICSMHWISESDNKYTASHFSLYESLNRIGGGLVELPILIQDLNSTMYPEK